jgi:hypothetical protein
MRRLRKWFILAGVSLLLLGGAALKRHGLRLQAAGAPEKAFPSPPQLVLFLAALLGAALGTLGLAICVTACIWKVLRRSAATESE